MTGTQTQRTFCAKNANRLPNKNNHHPGGGWRGRSRRFLLVMLPKWTLDTGQLYMQDGFSIGDPNAPVKVEQFSDFRCSHCQNFASI